VSCIDGQLSTSSNPEQRLIAATESDRVDMTAVARSTPI
jgi:hypothetical protein